ncbi:MAG: DUF4433 domain-containing protein [Acidimicrobiia bacterium]
MVHFTHIKHLPTIVTNGLLADNPAAAAGLLAKEIGNRSIKDQRRLRPVPIGPGGVVADYAPFYYAPRSPMLYAIIKGQVPEYPDGQDPLIYLESTVERLVAEGMEPLFTDRNAVLDFTKFSASLEELDSLVDWELMEAVYWYPTDTEPDRRERRMAECLVHHRVPWECFERVVVGTDARALEARRLLDEMGVSDTVDTQADWYF